MQTVSYNHLAGRLGAGQQTWGRRQMRQTAGAYKLISQMDNAVFTHVSAKGMMQRVVHR